MHDPEFSSDSRFIGRVFMGWIHDALPKLVIFTVVVALAGSAMGQQRQYRTLEKIPPLKGKWGAGSPVAPLTDARWSDGYKGHGYVLPDPNYKVKRTADGQVDIQGVWASTTTLKGGGQTSISSVARDLEQQKAAGNGTGQQGQNNNNQEQAQANQTKAAAVVQPVGEVLNARTEYKPGIRERMNRGGVEYVASSSACLPGGIMHQLGYISNQIIQSPGEVLIIAEHLTNFRHIPIDGRPHIGDKMKLWMGDSRGRWDKNTLTIDSANMNDKTGRNSDQRRIIETLTPVGEGILQYEVKVDDPVVYMRPYFTAYPLVETPNYEMFEENCSDGNRFTILELKNGKKIFPGFAALIE